MGVLVKPILRARLSFVVTKLSYFFESRHAENLFISVTPAYTAN